MFLKIYLCRACKAILSFLYICTFLLMEHEPKKKNRVLYDVLVLHFWHH